MQYDACYIALIECDWEIRSVTRCMVSYSPPDVMDTLRELGTDNEET